MRTKSARKDNLILPRPCIVDGSLEPVRFWTASRAARPCDGAHQPRGESSSPRWLPLGRCGGQPANGESLAQPKRKPVTPDVLVHSEGTVFLFNPLTPRAKEWIDQNVQEDAQWFGTTLVVEHGYPSKHGHSGSSPCILRLYPNGWKCIPNRAHCGTLSRSQES